MKMTIFIKLLSDFISHPLAIDLWHHGTGNRSGLNKDVINADLHFGLLVQLFSQSNKNGKNLKNPQKHVFYFKASSIVTEMVR